jgi:hypothetical protein
MPLDEWRRATARCGPLAAGRACHLADLRRPVRAAAGLQRGERGAAVGPAGAGHAAAELQWIVTGYALAFGSLLTTTNAEGAARHRVLATWQATTAAGATAGIVAGGLLTHKRAGLWRFVRGDFVGT